MTLKIERSQERVEHYHYDMLTEEFKGETTMNVGFAPLKADPKDNIPDTDTLLGTRLEFVLPFEKGFVLSGTISQVNRIFDRVIKTQEDVTQEEINTIARPLFKMIERLTREVTEIALDQPGIQLDFLDENNSQK